MTMVRLPKIGRESITLGHYTLTATGLHVTGKPSFAEHEHVGEFFKQVNRSSGFWLADWMRYGASRGDWTERIDQAVHATGLSEKTLKNIRAVGAIDPSRRRDDVDFSLHAEVAALPAPDQSHWLDKAATEGWTRQELRVNIRASKRARILKGQAKLEGKFHVIYADPPWVYQNRMPSGSSQSDSYIGMSIEEICKLPVAAHAEPDAVLFMWVTSSLLYQNPGPREVGEAWGFNYKSSVVWDKVLGNYGSYVRVHHEILTIWTRGACTPDRPTPQPDSVQTIRRDPDAEHSAKPEEFRKLITKLYDGPYLELFARRPIPGWSTFGNDARLWGHEEALANG